MKTIEELEQELKKLGSEMKGLGSEMEEIKKEFYFSSSGENQGGTSTTSPKPTPNQPSGDGDWVLLFDKDSDDPNINLGKTGEIKGSSGEFVELPDLSQYTRLKIVVFALSAHQSYEFDISDQANNSLRWLINNPYMTQIIGGGIDIEYNSAGKRILWIGEINQVYFYSNRYPAITNMKNEWKLGYERIYAK